MCARSALCLITTVWSEVARARRDSGEAPDAASLAQQGRARRAGPAKHLARRVEPEVDSVAQPAEPEEHSALRVESAEDWVAQPAVPAEHPALHVESSADSVGQPAEPVEVSAARCA